MCASYALLTPMRIPGKLVCIPEGCQNPSALRRRRLVPKLAHRHRHHRLSSRRPELPSPNLSLHSCLSCLACSSSLLRLRRPYPPTLFLPVHPPPPPSPPPSVTHLRSPAPSGSEKENATSRISAGLCRSQAEALSHQRFLSVSLSLSLFFFFFFFFLSAGADFNEMEHPAACHSNEDYGSLCEVRASLLF